MPHEDAAHAPQALHRQADPPVAPAEGAPARFPLRALAAFLLTVLLGPFLGQLPIAIALIISTLQAPLPTDTLSNFVGKAGALVLWAYAIGAAPAIVAAAGVSAVVWRRGTIGYGLTILISAGALLIVLAVGAGFASDGLVAAAGGAIWGLPLAIVAAGLGRWLTACVFPRLFT